MLAIVEYIKKNGLERAIKEFKLKTRIYQDKILLKYDQIESLMSIEEVQDCRGLILEKDTWKVMSLSFRKFFNSGEGHAASIDWLTAHVLEKLDGTMIQLYYDWHKQTWFAGTTGTAEGEGEVNNKLGTTFNQLFWITAEKNGMDKNLLLDKYVYVFELTTPYNIVVKPHGESTITLLTVRDVDTLEELSYEEVILMGKRLNVPVVKRFDLNKGNVGALLRTFDDMPWTDEGYVVVDGNFNRIKIKNPAYVAVHHLKSKTGEHNILSVVKSNEIEEFAATFPERREEIFRLKENYDLLIDKLNLAWSEIRKPKNITPDERKKFAMSVYEIAGKYNVKEFSGLFFGLHDNKVDSVKDYMYNFDDKRLYKIL